MRLFISLILLFSLCAYAKPKVQNEDVKGLSDIESAVLTTTGTLTNTQNCITSPASTTGLATGLYIYDSTTPGNIPSGTTIAGLPGTCSAGQIEMSNNAAGNGTGDTLLFGGQMSQLINDTKIYVTAKGLNEQLSTAITNGDIGGASSGSNTNLNFLTQKSEAEHFGIITDPLDNSVSSGFFQVPNSNQYAGALLNSVSSGANSLPLIWNPVFLDNAHKNTDLFNGTVTWLANFSGSHAGTVTTGTNFKVGSGSVKWTKTAGTSVISDVYYNEGSLNRSSYGFSDLWFWIYIPTASNVSNVVVSIGTSTSNYQQWTTTTNYAGSPLVNGENLINISVANGGTAFGSGWSPNTLFQYFGAGVTATGTDSYELNGVFFSQTGVASAIPLGSTVTVYDNTNREEQIISSSNTTISGGSVTTVSNLSHSYTGGFGTSSAVISRQTLLLGSNQAAMTSSDQFGNSLAGNIALTQEARLSTVNRSSLTAVTVDSFIDVNTPQVYQVQSTPSSTVVNITDPSTQVADMLSGETFHVFRTVSNANGKKSFIRRGDMILSVNSAQVSTTGTVSSSSNPSCVTSVGSTVGIAIGNSITDTTNSYIPSGTIVLGIGTGPCTSGQIQMSANATNSSSGDTIKIGADNLTCTGVGCVPSGTAIGDYVVKKHLNGTLSSVVVGANESFSSLTPMASPNDVILYDNGLPIPDSPGVFGSWSLSGSTGYINLQGGAPNLSVIGALTTTFPFLNGMFGTTNWGSSLTRVYEIAPPSSLNLDGNTVGVFAVSVWYYPTTIGTTRGILGLDAAGGGDGWYIQCNTSGAAVFVANNSGTATGGTLTLNKWNHIYVQHSQGVSNGDKIIVNGVLGSTGTSTINSSGSQPFVIGQEPAGAVSGLAATDGVAQVIAWSGTTPTQPGVIQLYNSGLAVVPTFGPRVKYQFENTSVSGQVLSIEGQTSRDTTNVTPFIGKMGIISK